jgi:hypothetical protein
MLHNFWKPKPNRGLEAPAPSKPADLVAEARAAMKAAEVACKIAKDELFLYECRSRTYGLKILPDQSVGFQLDTDPERLRLAAQAARLDDDFQRKTKRWSGLKDKSNETVFIAGVQVSR